MEAFKCDICKQYNDGRPYLMLLQVEPDDKVESNIYSVYQSHQLTHFEICKDCKKNIIKMIKSKNKLSFN